MYNIKDIEEKNAVNNNENVKLSTENHSEDVKISEVEVKNSEQKKIRIAIAKLKSK